MRSGRRLSRRIRIGGVVFDQITKVFGGRTVVETLDLEIEDGEFLVIVGPSGCGKTTTLRMLAGLETPSSGSLFIGGREVTKVPAQDRGIGMVFQNYALFPHMTIEKNLMFGLRTRRVARVEARRGWRRSPAFSGSTR